MMLLMLVQLAVVLSIGHARTVENGGGGNVFVDFGEDVQVQARAADDYPIDDYLAACGQAHPMGIKKAFKFQSPYFGSAGKVYPASVACEWAFIGDKDCTPEITCATVDIKQVDEDCSDEFLAVSDGVGGYEKFCGKKAIPAPLKSSKGLRDLFVRFQSSEAGTGRKGFFCEVKCSAKPAAVKELAQTQERKEDSRCVCGLQNKDDRIVGGQDAKLNEFPWQVAIVFPGTRSPKCGGAIINDRFVLTAAHCFVFEKAVPADIEVLFHAKSLDMTLQKGWKDVALGQQGSIRGAGYKDKQKTDKEEKTQRFKVLEIINHPLFTAKYDYDVSLLRLDRKIDLSDPDAPTPICLPDYGYTNVYKGAVPWVVGWGMPDENAGGTTRSLQKLDVPIIPLETCQSWSPYELTTRMLCAGYAEGKRDACTGDSGGPLSLKKPNNQWEQIGIVSWGEGCAQAKKPGLYSRVTELNQWVQYHTKGSTWCKTTKG